MMKRDTFGMGCNCGGYWWSFKPGAYHRRGSKGCWYDASGEQREMEEWVE
jgi:hypothetical protein